MRPTVLKRRGTRPLLAPAAAAFADTGAPGRPTAPAAAPGAPLTGGIALVDTVGQTGTASASGTSRRWTGRAGTTRAS